jgi:AraC-like DNA-binding protein
MVTLDQAGLNHTAVVMLLVPPSLQSVVELLWIDERPRLALHSPQWRVVADDAPHLIYYRYLDDDARVERHRLNVVGARTHYADVDCSRRLFTVGARLRPGAMPALFHVGAHELTNRSVSAELLVGRCARETLARAGDDSAASAARHVTSFLLDVLRRARDVDGRARWLANADLTHARTVHAVARAFGIGDRALRDWSATHLGLGLKRLLCIRRLHAALHARLADPDATWSRIAAASGFADQPHLVRDCRALLGESPSQFFARAS